MPTLNIPHAIEVAHQQGIDFSAYRRDLAAIVASTKDRDALIEALSRDILSAAIGNEARQMRHTVMMHGASDEEAQAIVASFLRGATVIMGKEATA